MPLESTEATFVSPDAAFVWPNAAFVPPEVTFVWQSAAFACQLISVTASIDSFVWHIAALHSPGARFAIGFARVASPSSA